MNRVNFNLLKNKITVLPAITSTPFKESLFKDKKVLITGGGTGLKTNGEILFGSWCRSFDC